MKKVILFILMCTLCIALFGCQNTEASTTKNTDSSVELLYETKDQYGNILSQVFIDQVSGKQWLKEYTYTQNERGVWVCINHNVTVLNAGSNLLDDPSLKIYHNDDLVNGPITVLDNEFVKVSIVKYLAKDYWWEFGYELKVVNKTNKIITVTISNASIMDINCAPLFSVDHIEAGNTAYFTLAWDKETLESSYIPYFDNVEFMIKIFDNDSLDELAISGTRVLLKQ